MTKLSKDSRELSSSMAIMPGTDTRAERKTKPIMKLAIFLSKVLASMRMRRH
jgi:hypothetical protein